jgi:ABC-type uncharacterized transport system substrate-binding protein
MRRREFIAGLGAAAWPVVVRAQGERVRRVSVLMVIDDDAEGQARLGAFVNGLQELGWTDGKNVQIEIRWASVASGVDRLSTSVAELVAFNPDLILASNSPALNALRNKSSTVPIVFVGISDPVGRGFVSNLARPNSNLTGFTNFEYPIASKWVETLKEIAPGVVRVGVIGNPRTLIGVSKTSPFAEYMKNIEGAARSFGIEPIASPVHDGTELNRVLEALARQPNGALLILPDPFTSSFRNQLVAQAAQNRLPAIYPYRFFATEGGLVAYGIELSDLYKRAASYADRILKGEKVGDLPIQAPNKFELVINLKTAATLGLTVPPTLLARADEVIE